MSDAALPDRPRTLEGAVLALIAAAVVEGVQAVALLGRIDQAREQVSLQDAGAADAVAGVLTAIGVGAIVYGLVLIALALLLRWGRTWARTALLVVSPLSLLGVIAQTTQGIVTVILVGLAVYMLYRREVGAWIAEVRRRRVAGAP